MAKRKRRRARARKNRHRNYGKYRAVKRQLAHLMLDQNKSVKLVVV
jgi:hypothetical protein